MSGIDILGDLEKLIYSNSKDYNTKRTEIASIMLDIG